MTVMKTGRICLYTGIIIFMAVLFQAQAARGEVEEFSGRVNIVFEDGSIMFYLGSGAGLEEGQQYNVVADGRTVARVHLVKVDDYSTVATVVESEGAIKEGAVYSFQKYVKGKKAAPKKSVEKKKSSRKRRTVEKKEPPEDIARKSTRRRKAAAQDDDQEVVRDLKLKGEEDEEEKPEKRKTSKRRKKTTEKKSLDKKEDKKEDKKKDEKKPGKTRTAAKDEGEIPEMKKPEHGPRYLKNGVSRFGQTGLLLLPTAEIIDEDQARIGWGYQKYSSSERFVIADVTMDAWTHDRTNSYYFTYGLDESIEINVISRDRSGYTRVMDVDTGATVENSNSSKSSELGIKYSWPWSSEDTRTNPTRGGIYLSWNDVRYEDNRDAREIKYGLAAGVVMSDNATLHGTIGRDRINYSGTGWGTLYDNSDTDRFWGLGLEYRSNPFTSILVEYYRYDVDTGDASYDYDITETSVGVRHRPNPDVLLDAAYIMHEEDTNMYGSGLSLDDNYYLLRLNYLL